MLYLVEFHIICRTTVKSFTYKSTDFQIIIKWILTLFIINTLQFFKLYQLSKNACVHGPCSVMSDSATPQTCQAPLSIEFFRQEHWSRFPFPTPWDLPNPGIEPESLAPPALAGRFFITVPKHWPMVYSIYLCILHMLESPKTWFYKFRAPKNLDLEICLFHY